MYTYYDDAFKYLSCINTYISHAQNPYVTNPYILEITHIWMFIESFT